MSTNKKKLQIFCAFVARSQGRKSGSVSNVYFCLKNRLKDMLFLGEWTKFKKYFRTNYWTGKSVNLNKFYIEKKNVLKFSKNRKNTHMKWRIAHKMNSIFWSKEFFITLNFWLKVILRSYKIELWSQNLCKRLYIIRARRNQALQ